VSLPGNPWVAPLGTIRYMSARGRAPVAQLDRVLPSEGRGHTFESCRVRQISLLTISGLTE
jgi:hypothetical protein